MGCFVPPQRSFKRELFETAAAKLERAMIKVASEVETFRSIGQKAYSVLQTNMMKDKDYSDAPDHFMGECASHVPQDSNSSIYKRFFTFNSLRISNFHLLKHWGAAVGYRPYSVILGHAFLILKACAFVQWKLSFIFHFCVFRFSHIEFLYLEESLYTMNL